MKNLFLLCAFLFGVSLTINAQIRTESSAPSKPLDDVVSRTLMEERQVLKFPPIREADIFWEKRIWRVIDVREKMNQPFTYPKAPLFKIIANAAEEGRINLYQAGDAEEFAYPVESVDGILYERDTILIENIETGEMIPTPIVNDFNSEDIKRFRIKELWYFDENTATMKVRILGIAPLKDVFDNNGNFRYETPLFWAYYPELREELAKHKVFNPLNDSSLISWEDLFEMRYFASYVYKESNVKDRRLSDYLSGVDLLLEADKIKQEIFNFEHDLWSY